MGTRAAHGEQRRQQRQGAWRHKGQGGARAQGERGPGVGHAPARPGLNAYGGPVAAVAAVAPLPHGQLQGIQLAPGAGYPPLLAQAQISTLSGLAPLSRESQVTGQVAVPPGPLPSRASAAVPQGGNAPAASIASIEEMIERDVARMQPRRNRLRQCIEDAVAASEALEGCSVEVVGSTSWGGDVPQSDLDLVLLTPDQTAEGRRAVELLECLRQRLELKEEKERPWKRLELLEAPRVPILRLHDAQGLSCEISVDQHTSIRHRGLLREIVSGRPEACSLVRLIKLWLRRRGLPVAAEGGLPSLAWAVTALRLAEEQPPGTSVENLLVYYFSKMQQLGEMSLAVRQLPQTAQFIWKPRGPGAWSEEWMQLLLVDDPTCPVPPQAGMDGFHQAASTQSLTPPSIPAALAALYIAELRLAWKAIRESKWDELWRGAPPEVRMALPSAIDLKGGKAPLHILLKNGVVVVGQLQEVHRCPSVQQEALHRRDQSSELLLQPCGLEKDGGDSGSMTMVKSREGAMLSCQPCHWVCALPTWNTKVVPGDGLARLSEVTQLVEAPVNPLAMGAAMQKGGWYIAAALPAGRGLARTFFQPVAIPVWPVWPANMEVPSGHGGNYLAVSCGNGLRGRWQNNRGGGPWPGMSDLELLHSGQQQSKSGGKGKGFGAKSAGKGHFRSDGVMAARATATDKAHSDDSTRASDSDVESQRDDPGLQKRPPGALPPGAVDRSSSSGDQGLAGPSESPCPPAAAGTDDANAAVGNTYSDAGSNDGCGSDEHSGSSASAVASAAAGAEALSWPPPLRTPRVAPLALVAGRQPACELPRDRGHSQWGGVLALNLDAPRRPVRPS